MLLYKELQDIPICRSCKFVKPIRKGFSKGHKYYIETNQDKKFLIKIFDKWLYEEKKKEYEYQITFLKADIPTQTMIDLGICNHGKCVYQVFSWINGNVLDKFLPKMNSKEQYSLGVQAGKLLKKIHSQYVKEPCASFSSCLCFRKEECLRRYQQYRSSNAEIFDGNVFYEYVENNKPIAEPKIICFLHGDYHTANMIMGIENKLYVIDWVYGMLGEPYEDFVRIVVSAEISPYFCCGQIDGYFGGKPPDEFWDKLLFYIAMHQLDILRWDFPKTANGEPFSKHQHENVLKEYDGMNSKIPMFYRNNKFIMGD